MNISAKIDKFLSLIKIEEKEEILQQEELYNDHSLIEIQKMGLCLLGLRLCHFRTGLFGKQLLTFDFNGKDLVNHRFRNGDEVKFVQQSGNWSVSYFGIVSHCTSKTLVLVADKISEPLTLNYKFQIRLISNGITYKRLCAALNHLRSLTDKSDIDLYLSVVLGIVQQDTVQVTLQPPKMWFNDSLNKSQREAVTHCLNQKYCGIIHGPPGTGKTTTLIEVILQEKNRGSTILACAPSNVAADNIASQLVGKCNLTRLGHPARTAVDVRKFTLDAKVVLHDDADVVLQIRREIQGNVECLSKTKDRSVRENIKRDLKFDKKELRKREERIIRDIMTSTDVIVTTLTSANPDSFAMSTLRKKKIDLIVIDECSQATEPAAWVSLPQASKCILAGDPKQLCPTVISRRAEKGGLSVSLMERLMKTDCNLAKLLTVQYRMNTDIMEWSSSEMYDGKLVSHDSVKGHLLSDIDGVAGTDETSVPLILIDTCNQGLFESTEESSTSKCNMGEAEIISIHVERLIAAGVSENHIGIISPYNYQVDILREKLSQYKGIEVKSIDSFQGREKEAILISLVRSNDAREVGFLSDERRINVAITRARRHVCVVCDSVTISHNEFLKRFVEYVYDRGIVKLAQNYMPTSETECVQSVNDELVFDKSKLSSYSAQPNVLPSTDFERTRFGCKPNTLDVSEVIDDRPCQGVEESSKFDDIVPIQNEIGIASMTVTETISENVDESDFTNESEDVFSGKHDLDDTLAKSCDTNQALASSSKIEDVSSKEDSKAQELCYFCDKSICLQNFLDHEVLCYMLRQQNRPAVVFAAVKESTHVDANIRKEFPEVHFSKGKRKVPDKRSGKKCIVDIEIDESSADFDEAIKEIITINKTCNVDTCKKVISVLGFHCNLCNSNYCINHQQYELHGCGEAIKRQLRRDRARPKSSQALKDTARNHLQRKLKSSIANMAADRDKTRTSKKK